MEGSQCSSSTTCNAWWLKRAEPVNCQSDAHSVCPRVVTHACPYMCVHWMCLNGVSLVQDGLPVVASSPCLCKDCLNTVMLPMLIAVV